MRKYAYVFSLGVQSSMEYRSDLWLSLLSAVFPIILQLFIWKAIYTDSEMIYAGYTYAQIVLYSLMSGLVTKLTTCGFEYRINEDIKLGGLNKFITRPINYFFYCLFEFEGTKIFPLTVFTAVSVVLIGSASALLPVVISAKTVILCAVSIIGALLLNFLIYFCLAVGAFWITEISELFGTINIIAIVLSGGILPLDIFGERIFRATAVLPFLYTVQFPLSILNGRFESGQIQKGFCIQFFWIALLAIAAWCLWKKGLKRYVAVGG